MRSDMDSSVERDAKMRRNSDVMRPAWEKAYGRLRAPAPRVAEHRLKTLLLTLPSLMLASSLNLAKKGLPKESVDWLATLSGTSLPILLGVEARGLSRGLRSGWGWLGGILG